MRVKVSLLTFVFVVANIAHAGTLSIAIEGDGSVTVGNGPVLTEPNGQICPPSCVLTFPEGAYLQITAVPTPGTTSMFGAWTLAGTTRISCFQSSCEGALIGSVALKAKFAPTATQGAPTAIPLAVNFVCQDPVSPTFQVTWFPVGQPLYVTLFRDGAEVFRSTNVIARDSKIEEGKTYEYFLTVSNEIGTVGSSNRVRASFPSNVCPASTAPLRCMLTNSTNALPMGGGKVELAVNCTGSAVPTEYLWSASPFPVIGGPYEWSGSGFANVVGNQVKTTENKVTVKIPTTSIVGVTAGSALGNTVRFDKNIWVDPRNANYTGLWWNSTESGWGINFNHQGDTLFATVFTYDAFGRPIWLVMSNGSLRADGKTFSGDLFETKGSPFSVVPFLPITARDFARVGSMTVTFSSENEAILSYSYKGSSITKTVRPQVFGGRAAVCKFSEVSRSSLSNYQDLWWNPNEPGWGVNLAHQGSILFATLFVYDGDGKATWFVMSNGSREADGSFAGDLYHVTGPAFDSRPFNPITPANVTRVGTMRFRFTNGADGNMTYSVNGVSVSKTITRQVFSTSASACE